MRNAISLARGLAWALPVAVLAVAACDDDRATLTDAVGDPSFDFDMGADVVGLPSGSAGLATAGADSTVRLTLRHLGALQSGVYQFWTVERDAAGNDVATAVAGRVVEYYRRDSLAGGEPVIDPITGEDTIRVVDSTVVAASGAFTYTGSDDPFVDSVRAFLSNQDAANGGFNPYPTMVSHAVVVSLEAAEATTPGGALFMWRRTGLAGGGSLAFGNFGGTDEINADSPNDYRFGVAGSGLGGFRGLEVSTDFEQLARPPVGFYYAMYLVGDPGDRATFVDTLLVDTLRSAYSADPEVSRVSLFDADTDQLLPGVGPANISRAQVRNCVAGSATNNCQNTLTAGGTANSPWNVYRAVWLNLAPKGTAAGLGRTRLLLGAVPAEVQGE